jgi:hypothetical protein
MPKPQKIRLVAMPLYFGFVTSCNKSSRLATFLNLGPKKEVVEVNEEIKKLSKKKNV